MNSLLGTGFSLVDEEMFKAYLESLGIQDSFLTLDNLIAADVNLLTGTGIRKK